MIVAIPAVTSLLSAVAVDSGAEASVVDRIRRAFLLNRPDILAEMPESEWQIACTSIRALTRTTDDTRTMATILRFLKTVQDKDLTKRNLLETVGERDASDFVIRSTDLDALRERLQWFYDEALSVMFEAALLSWESKSVQTFFDVANGHNESVLGGRIPSFGPEPERDLGLAKRWTDKRLWSWDDRRLLVEDYFAYRNGGPRFRLMRRVDVASS